MTTSSHLRRKPKAVAVRTTITPPMTLRSRSSSLSSFDDEAYFSKTYIPLSSLPTPPLSSHSNYSHQPEAFFSAGDVLDPELLGPAIHLCNLIPSSTSLTTVSVPLVHAILTRADLPLEVIALAVCILDSLNSRFALRWRKDCPLVKTRYPSTWSDEESTSEQHIDSIHPELIVLAALILAVKFLDDAQQHTKEYATEWGKGLWTCDQINYTQRCLLENLGYRILPLWEHNIILDALEDMGRAGRQYTSSETHDHNKDWNEDAGFGAFRSSGLGDVRGAGSRTATLGLESPMSPVETPLGENAKGTRDISCETGTACQAISLHNPQLPDRTQHQEEPFPVYIEPAIQCLGLGISWGL